jgi:hypothetical protein
MTNFREFCYENGHAVMARGSQLSGANPIA